jgi:hypothetical protein
MRVFAIAAVAAAVSLAAPAKAATITNYKVSSWDLAAFSDDKTGRFTHCAASARYRSGILLLFSVSDTFQWSIGFSSPEWDLRQGRSFDVDFRIDGGRAHSVRGIAANTRLIRATLPDSVDLFNQFRYGNRLVVRVDDRTPVNFDLTDTNPMLTEILRCAQKYKDYAERPASRPRESTREGERDAGLRSDTNRSPANRNTGVGSDGSFRERNDNNRVARVPDRNEETRRSPERQPAPSPNISLGPTPESRAEATQIATDILRRANFTFEFQKPEQLTASQRDRNDVIWRAEEFLGTLRIFPDARADTIEKIRSDVISADTATCKGKLDTGTLPTPADSKSVTMFTACKGEQVMSTYYIILPRRKGGIYLLGILGSGEAAARLQSVAVAYRTVALEVLDQ